MCHLFVESSLINVKQSGLNGETLASSSSCQSLMKYVHIYKVHGRIFGYFKNVWEGMA